MKPDLKWLDDPQVFRVGKLPAHSDHLIFASEEEMKKGDSSFYQNLNGTWQFSYSNNASERPVNFYEQEFDASGFDEIAVPGHIEFAGYDTIHYINMLYPWEGKIYRRPAYAIEQTRTEEGSFSEAAYNPVGSYRKEFDLDKELIGKRVCIRFEGVEQAAYVWLNGNFVGYTEDSFDPAEFDLTPYIKEKSNVLAVEVHKRSTAAYLEDQDFFRFFGIYRNVTLYAKPLLHLEDMWAKPYLAEDNVSGHLELTMKLSGGCKACVDSGNLDEQKLFAGAKVKVTLADKGGKVICKTEADATGEIQWSTDILKDITPWDNRNPYLYQLLITLTDGEGNVVEVIPYEVGFRRVEIIDKVIYLNGKRLIINGVNRHEWSAESGRCISVEDMKWDMDCFKRNHINAVRTCHYPDQIAWYYMCDTNGIYMMSECNLETHGSWMITGPAAPVWNVPGSVPQWKDVVLDRAASNFETFKNHTAILFWSLGNESFAGDNIAAMNRYFKEKDDTRLVHYEGVTWNRAYEDVISDVESRMYAPPKDIEEYLNNNPKKPFILCEYMHDMGNSIGGMGSYIALLDKYEMYQGGFIWDYIDQAVAVTDEVTGRKVLRYGGDFDDRPADYEFSGNGIVFADRTEKPAMQEVRYYYGLHE